MGIRRVKRSVPPQDTEGTFDSGLSAPKGSLKREKPLAARKKPSEVDPWTQALNDSGESDSNWMVSYADMVTLLMSFFALMFGFSKMDESKFEQLKKEVTSKFGSTYLLPLKANAPDQAMLPPSKDNKAVDINDSSRGINIVFKNSLLFAPGSPKLQESSQVLLDRVIEVLATTAKGFPIYVEGHTDDSPVKGDRYPSNWELSAARASMIVRQLEAKGIEKSFLHPMGYGDSKPVAPNRTPDGKPILENQAMNRRVVIRILKPLSDEPSSSGGPAMNSSQGVPEKNP